MESSKSLSLVAKGRFYEPLAKFVLSMTNNQHDVVKFINEGHYLMTRMIVIKGLVDS